jgi:hypothetical protein
MSGLGVWLIMYIDWQVLAITDEQALAISVPARAPDPLDLGPRK